MSTKLESYLEKAREVLKKESQKSFQDVGLTKESVELELLHQLVKEQFSDEDTCRTASSPR